MSDRRVEEAVFPIYDGNANEPSGTPEETKTSDYKRGLNVYKHINIIVPSVIRLGLGIS